MYPYYKATTLYKKNSRQFPPPQTKARRLAHMIGFFLWRPLGVVRELHLAILVSSRRDCRPHTHTAINNLSEELRLNLQSFTPLRFCEY